MNIFIDSERVKTKSLIHSFFSEMIHGIALSIRFDEVLEELRELFSKTSKNNGNCDAVNDASPVYGE